MTHPHSSRGPNLVASALRDPRTKAERPGQQNGEELELMSLSPGVGLRPFCES